MIKKSSILLSIIFVISPFWALPVIFYFIYKRSYLGIVFLALFMGIMSHLILPSGDLYRYHLEYDLYKISDFSEITNSISFDFVYPVTMFLFSKIISFELFRLLVCFISYLLFFQIFIKISKNNIFLDNNNQAYIVAFILFFSAGGFGLFITSVRYSIALSITLYSIYHIYHLRDNTRYWLIIFACFIHLSMLFYLLLIFISIYFKIQLKLYHIISYILIFVISYLNINVNNINLFSLIGPYFALNSILYIKLFTYLDPNNFTNPLSSSVGLFMSYLVSYIFAYLAFLYLLFKYKNYNIFSFFVLVFILAHLFFYIYTLYYRLLATSVLLFIFPLLIKCKNLKILFLFTFYSFLIFCSSIYFFKKDLILGNSAKIIYTPLPILLNTHYETKQLNLILEDDGSYLKR